MRVILDIEDNVLAEMKMHADIKQEDLNVMLSNMFIQAVSKPYEVIRQEQEKDNCVELESFHTMYYKFLSDLAHDSNYIVFHKVILRLRDEHAVSLPVLIDLFKTYKTYTNGTVI